MKKAVIAILIGFACAIASCAAIKMQKANAKLQQADTGKERYMSPPAVPAMIIINPVKQNQVTTILRQNNRPFKDSVINGLISIKQAVDIANQKLDSGLSKQTEYIGNEGILQNKIDKLQSQILNLRLDTSKLYKTAIVTRDIKDDAVFGNTFKSFSVYVLVFIASGIIAILIMIFYVHRNLSHNIKRITKSHAT